MYLTFESRSLFKYVQENIRILLQEGKIAEEAFKYGKKYRRQLKKSWNLQSSVRWAGDKIGFGLFAEEVLAPGAYIGAYTGVITHNDDPSNDYLFRYPVMGLNGKNLVIDARQNRHPSRFINHSDTPNAQVVTAFDGKLFHQIILATQPIAPEQQLFLDYGKSFWSDRSPPEKIESNMGNRMKTG